MNTSAILGAVVTLTLGAAAQGWWDLFHLVVGVIVLGGVAAIAVAARRRTALDGE